MHSRRGGAAGLVPAGARSLVHLSKTPDASELVEAGHDLNLDMLCRTRQPWRGLPGLLQPVVPSAILPRAA